MTTQRRFAHRCAECRQKSMSLVVISYDTEIDHDGKTYDVHISAFSVPQCKECHAMSFDDVASDQIDRAFRQAAGLLTPEEIYQGRVKVGYPNQQEFADCLGIAVSTISRWENGAQVQKKFNDNILRAFFECPEFRRFIAYLNGKQPKDFVQVRASNSSINLYAPQLLVDPSSSYTIL